MDGSTPRPWRADSKVVGWWADAQHGCMIRFDQEGIGHALANCLRYSVGDKVAIANARRIVAAVNATSDLPIEALEADVVRKVVEAAQRSETALHNLVVLLTDRDPTETEAMIVKLVGAVSRELEAVLAPLKGEQQ